MVKQTAITLLVVIITLNISYTNAFAPQRSGRAQTPKVVERSSLIQPSYLILKPTRGDLITLSAKGRRFSWLRSNNDNNVEPEEDEETLSRRRRLRARVVQLAQRMVNPMPKAIASVLSDATLGAVDMAVDEVMNHNKLLNTKGGSAGSTNGQTNMSPTNFKSSIANGLPAAAKDAILSELTLDLVNDAFEPMERSLVEMETSLDHARDALNTAKSQASQAIEAIQAAAIAEAMGAASVVEAAEQEAERKVIETIYSSANDDDIMETLTLEDVDFGTSEMAPPFLDEASCLIPGEPIVRVEKAPENSRRIFAGIDIMASADDVWKVLTEYDNLQNVVPNLVVNDVLDVYDGITDYSQVTIDGRKSDRDQCQEMAEQMKGSLLKQVGGAKVAGINFSARTTLEVREWPQGLPDFAHFQDEMWDGQSRDDRAKESVKTKLERYAFPRPFAVSSLPTKDISMQSIPSDDGEFRLYQGVWRMQPLPGCSPDGGSAMRLTYAVEISPRAYLPVQLVEGRIVKDLCNNLLAVRDCVAGNAVA